MTPAQIRERVRASRRAQGLGETVTAGRFLDDLAREVLGLGQEIAREAAA
jgi:hypothetical protein